MRLLPVMSANYPSSTPGGSTAVTVVLGLNAALQKRFVLEQPASLVPGNVHRAQSVQVGVGGKGQDVAVTLRCLQYASYRLMQFVGSGAEGDAVWSMLQDMFDREVFDACTVRTDSHLRTCTSIVSAKETTELVEPSGAVSPEELERLLDVASSLRADALCVMGSLPPGCPDDTYAQLYRRVATPQTLCLIDSVVGLEPLLQAIAEKKSPTLLKCNASELCRLANVSAEGGSPRETDSVPQEVLVAAIQGFLQQTPNAQDTLTAIAVTDGAHPAHLAALPVSSCEREWRLFQLPVATLRDDPKDRATASASSSSLSSMAPWGQHSWIDATSAVGVSTGASIGATPAASAVHPIGAGDAVAAGTLAAWKALADRRRESAASKLPTGPASPPSSPRRQALSPPPPPPPAPAQRMHPELHAVLAGNESPLARALLAAFSFGLACGTASCLQEDNSVVDVDDVLRLYNREGRPIFLASYQL